ncbi:DUF2460 domain-containing protein [Aquamicrobium sp. LC103]|uniref:DUF2460 domain-containing protein n=1 Tax=Aquamicrobium sp. LC103 TaxID=1120658 RepID=UPI00063E9BDF|nr:DUF2460 domain-containing protein [Aquamicrobium sp. LC103]TKT81234.1 TIGR02217 family protein [Aquamicrobium sp. LC103]
MDSFHEVRFPGAVSFGATGGPERRNEIVALTSGRERRNLRFEHSRRHYDAGTGVRSLEDLQEIVAFFEARRGSLHGFRFRDPFDMKSCNPGASPTPLDQFIGTGDGSNASFQLAKRYGDGEDAHIRPIRKPVAGSVLVAVAGVAKANPADFTVDHLTGTVTFTHSAVPVSGAAVTTGFQFDVPVRFDAERLSISLSAFRAGQIPSIPLVEIEP